MPTETPADTIAIAGRTAPGIGVEVEVRVVRPRATGRLRRSRHACAYGRTKGNRQFVREDKSGGMPLSAGDDTAIQRINGIQATWESYVNLPAEIGMHRSAGVGRLRITPRAVVMVAVAAQSRGGRDGRSGLDEAEAGLWEVFPGVRFSNGFLRPAASQGPIAMAAPA